MDFQFTDGRVYCLDENKEVLAEATYVHTSNGEVDIDHTYVSPVLRGQGVAAKMMEAVAAQLRARGLKATATCSYANAWLRHNREAYGDILSGSFIE
jgi:predicted GNAT family acetyltransferase